MGSILANTSNLISVVSCSQCRGVFLDATSALFAAHLVPLQLLGVFVLHAFSSSESLVARRFRVRARIKNRPCQKGGYYSVLSTSRMKNLLMQTVF